MSPPNIPLLDNRALRWVPLLLCLALSGCSSYYGQLLQGQLQVLRQREPIDAVLADPARDPHLRQRLALAQQARRFASAALHLPDNRSYRVYADIGRPFVVWNVFATPRYSLAPVEHCFPIAGCVAYRGYYQQGRARGAAALLSEEGLDTYVGGVEAYSTLGWFDDPLLSSMLRWDDDRLAATIFHELAHQQLYVADDTAFNESFASFVEQQGLREWRIARCLPAPDARQERQRRQFTELILTSRERLQALYAEPLDAAQKGAGKATEFERLRAEYRTLRDGQWGGDTRYDAWMAQPLNNARLLPFGLYDQWVEAFAVLFQRANGDWREFYRRAAEIGRLPAAGREQALASLL
ncbi:aminopeptidase [Pseudomonas kuykendallii]|uniref:Predicted aminopeptidase n=1 Tax=Pseudomonas kuykendallii TaxID=1007099 RepID=A0A1H2SFZ6_9PSED|nr:aminopeptidase [Pseudomonas kuykendallii]MCQ4270522.1 aminopeptidase [Pseudomonas kuykendallii]SDW30623.1 Predicted aminopeptidase [Pseudomonas kuykendallii]